MALHIISVVLFTVFVSEALTLTCFNCTSTPPATCTQTANCSQCSSMTTTMTSIVGSNVDVKSCAAASCVNFSINLELFRSSSKCCSSDYCNNATDSENGLSCNGTDGTLKCKGGENKCITVAVGFNDGNYTYKGCTSQNICLNSALVILPPGVNVFNYSCFEANNTQGPVSAGTSTFFHLKSVLDGFLLVVLVFGWSVLSL